MKNHSWLIIHGLMGTEFQFGMIKKFWGQIVAIVAQCEHTLRPLNCTLKNGKSCMCISPHTQKEHLTIMAGTNVISIVPWPLCKVLYFLWKKV